MQNSSLFRSNAFFLIFSILSILTGLATTVLCVMDDNMERLFVALIAVIALVLYISYRRHQKNLMKGLMGSVLMWLLVDEANYAINLFFSEREFFEAQFGEVYPMYAAVKLITVLIILCVFALHFLINSDRHSSPMEVGANQSFCVLLIAGYVADICLDIFFGAGYDLSVIFLLVFKICLMNQVLCIEAKLDGFRQAREAKGWTES